MSKPESDWHPCASCKSRRKACRWGDACCGDCLHTGGATHTREPCAEFGEHPVGAHADYVRRAALATGQGPDTGGES